MFKSARWRSEKNRIKAEFKLLFNATQVSHLGVDSLVLSVVPGDVGKPTSRLEKATIRDGSCRWENPAFETVKFVRDPKNGKITERIYYFLVSAGSSKPGPLGEASIDFADYVDSTKPSSVSLPLKNSNSSDAVLHVWIQRLQPRNVNQREVEESEVTKVKLQDRSLKNLINSDADETTESDCSKDGLLDKPQQSFKPNGIHRTISESDTTLSSCGSSSGLDTPKELQGRNNCTSHEPTVISDGQETDKLAAYNSESSEENDKSKWEWSGDTDHGVTNNSAADNRSTETSQQDTDIKIEKLKAEVSLLSRQADVSELELQTLRKQMVKERKKSQDLSREISSLKQERDALRSECENLKRFHMRIEDAKLMNKLESEGRSLLALLQEMRQELNHEKDLNANLKLQLQKTQESNNELILAVRDLEEILEKNGDKPDISDNSKVISKREAKEDEEQKVLEILVKDHCDTNETYLLEQKVISLYGEVEMYRREKDELEMQMEQLALDYEILKQENHDISIRLQQSQLQEQLKMQCECSATINELETQIENLENELKLQQSQPQEKLKMQCECSATVSELETQIGNLENELKRQSQDLSDSLATVNSLQSGIKNLEEELEKQAQGFEANLETLTKAKVEQEQRAILAGEELRTTKQKNVDTAERLQEEFRNLSMLMTSTIDANEKAAMKALAEAGELRVLTCQLEEALKKAREELQMAKNDYEAKLSELSQQLSQKTCYIDRLMLNLDTKSKQLDCLEKQQEEVCESFCREIQMLGSEIERLNNEISILSHRAEETEQRIQNGNVDRIQLAIAVAIIHKEAQKSGEELNRIRHISGEKETALELLQSEFGEISAQCKELEHSLVQCDLEKENLKKQVSQWTDDLEKKEEAFRDIENKLKQICEGTASSNGAKDALEGDNSTSVFYGSREAGNLLEKIEILEEQLKMKQNVLQALEKSFLAKETDLHSRDEELESRLEELNQIATCQKVDGSGSDHKNNGGIPEESSRAECSVLPEENCKAESIERNGDVSSDIVLEPASFPTKGCNSHQSSTELSSLKEKNEAMESELKEMQERYSEISLKFAEVEGERQQLVMTLRNLKNFKKS